MTRPSPDFSKPLPIGRTLPGTIMRWIFIVAVVLATISGISAKLARAACSVPMMMALAQEHSNDQARRDQMDHRGFDSRARRGARAENVAYGVKTKEKAIAMWWRSPPHAANMRLPGCRAVAHAVSASGRWYWTLEVGQ